MNTERKPYLYMVLNHRPKNGAYNPMCVILRPNLDAKFAFVKPNVIWDMGRCVKELRKKENKIYR